MKRSLLGLLYNSIRRLKSQILYLFMFCLMPYLPVATGDRCSVLEQMSTKRIKLKKYPRAFNPSLIKWKDGYLLAFRNLPDLKQLWVSELGLVYLSKDFTPLCTPQILDIRQGNLAIPCQGEDPRLFMHEGKLYISYNDNRERINPSSVERRDIYIAELAYVDHQFEVVNIQKLYHQKDYGKYFWQKNWSPFVWQGTLYFSYSINPHEVVAVNEETGECPRACITATVTNWVWGKWRGGTPSEIVDGEYLGFFHSSCVMKSEASRFEDKWHYFMGAYTFSPEPPFGITSYTPSPLIAPGFYSPSKHEKKVIFPGGYVVDGSQIHIAYGKDDEEIWIATIEKNLLKELMVPVTAKTNEL